MGKITIDQRGVHKLLSNLQPHNATGPNEILTFVLKAVADDFAPFLTRLFQAILDNGMVPQDWKDARDVPIGQLPSSIPDFNNMQSHGAHRAEKSHDPLDKFDILCDNQHGFHKKRQFETLLIVTIHEIAKHLSCGNQVDVILLNFAKAFDKVTNARLLHKLDFCGIRGSLIFSP